MLDVMQFMRQAVAAAMAAGRVFSEDFAASEFAQAAAAAAAESARSAGDLLDKALSRLLESGAVQAMGEELQAGVAALKERGAPLAAEAQEELKGLADAVVENLEDVEVEDLQKALQVGRVAVFVCEAGGARVCCETRADGRCMHAVRVDLRPRTSLAS